MQIPRGWSQLGPHSSPSFLCRGGRLQSAMLSDDPRQDTLFMRGVFAVQICGSKKTAYMLSPLLFRKATGNIFQIEFNPSDGITSETRVSTCCDSLRLVPVSCATPLPELCETRKPGGVGVSVELHFRRYLFWELTRRIYGNATARFGTVVKTCRHHREVAEE